jgi:streptomycin 6-kinase
VAALCHHDFELAVNGDLHSDQLLRGEREPWLTVDPVLLRGDIAYDLGPRGRLLAVGPAGRVHRRPVALRAIGSCL